MIPVNPEEVSLSTGPGGDLTAPDIWATAIDSWLASRDPRATAESVKAAQAIVASSGRRTDTPVRKAFVRSDDDAAPPMAKLYAGGRSGTVAIKLYLALIWRCAQAPFQTAKPTRAWATLLDLPDPGGKGARRISAAMKTLEQHRLILSEPMAGQPSVVTLFDEGGQGRPYSLPSSSHSRALHRRQSKGLIASHVYFKVASRLWLDGYFQQLRGPGLTMLLILLAEQGGEGKDVWFSTSVFHQRYRISHQTRATGTAELVKNGLLRIERQSVARDQKSDVFDPRRMRNIYKLQSPALVLPASQARETALS